LPLHVSWGSVYSYTDGLTKVAPEPPAQYPLANRLAKLQHVGAVTLGMIRECPA